MTPSHLRALAKVSAVEMARRLRLTRVGLRLLESAPTRDWKVSELDDYLKALGLQLELHALDRRKPARGPVVLALAALLALFGCAPVALDPAELDSQLAGPFVLHAGEPEPEACGATFDPAPELLKETEAAAARWSAATGCDVRVEAGGHRIELWPSMRGTLDADGHLVAVDPLEGSVRMCGATDSFAGWSAVAPCSKPLDFSVTHEMGHALARNQRHAESGLMADRSTVDLLDAASLELVCAGLACSAFVPEAE